MEGVGERFARDSKTGESYTVPKDMTYKEWKAKQNAAYGEGFVDKQRTMGYNREADIEQFERYKKRLGSDAPESFDAFMSIKDDATAYKELQSFYAYKGRVPEATASDYKAYQKIKDIGFNGSVRVPPLSRQHAYILEDKKARRDPAHIMKRMYERHITADEVQSFIDNALFTESQFHGERIAFYSENGVAVLTRTADYPDIDWIVKTTWNKSDFDDKVVAAIKEVKNVKSINSIR